MDMDKLIMHDDSKFITNASFSNNGSDNVDTCIIIMNGTKLITQKDPISDKLLFAGVSEGNSFIDQITGKSFEMIYNLLIKAINNRTVERDYFRLYSEHMSGILSEDEFEKELDDHEDNYVIQNNITPSKPELLLALSLVKDIKDVETSEDLSSLFSFNSIDIEKMLPCTK